MRITHHHSHVMGWSAAAVAVPGVRADMLLPADLWSRRRYGAVVIMVTVLVLVLAAQAASAGGRRRGRAGAEVAEQGAGGGRFLDSWRCR